MCVSVTVCLCVCQLLLALTKCETLPEHLRLANSGASFKSLKYIYIKSHFYQEAFLKQFISNVVTLLSGSAVTKTLTKLQTQNMNQLPPTNVGMYSKAPFRKKTVNYWQQGRHYLTVNLTVSCYCLNLQFPTVVVKTEKSIFSFYSKILMKGLAVYYYYLHFDTP